jgi:AraC family transcriptional regulator, arabinose operon regulatory protein
MAIMSATRMRDARQRVVLLPKPAINEALSGGVSSLWIPVEVGHTSGDPGYRVVAADGSRDLVVGVCAGGSGFFEYAKTRREIAEGLAWASAPGIPYTYGSDGESPWSLYWLRATGARISWIRNMLVGEGSDPVFPFGELFPVASLFEEIMDILEAGRAKKDLDRAALILGHLAAALLSGRPQAGEREETADERIDRVASWIETHPSSDLRVSALAAMCNLSAPYFSACFRRRTGSRVLDFIARSRMGQARRLLEETSRPVKDIAASLGYSDQLYFSRSFRKAYGCPPLAMRAKATSQGDPSP